MIHDLKCWPEFFQDVKDGTKTFELRKNDRNYQVRDILHLREWDKDKFHEIMQEGVPGNVTQRTRVASGMAYTGRETWCRVTYMIDHVPVALIPGYVCMSVVKIRKPRKAKAKGE